MNPEVDRDREAICLKCLARNPAERYASAASLADDLDRWSRAENIRARSASPWERLCRWARRKPATVALIAALYIVGLAGLLGVLTQWFRAERHAAAAQTAAWRVGQQLVDLQVANGVRSVESGDLLGALPWFAEAARLQPTNELHRLCLANALRAAPALERVWDLGAPVQDAAWSPDGRRMLAGSENGQVLVTKWAQTEDPAGGDEQPALLQFPVGVRCLAFAPDGATAAFGCADGRILLLHLADTGLRELSEPESAAVRAIAFSGAGRHLAAGGQDRHVRLWSLTEAASPLALPHDEMVTDVAFSPDSSLLLTTALDGTANLWRVTDGARVGQPIRSSEGLFAGDFSPDGTRLMTAGAAGNARLWTAAEQQSRGARMHHHSWITWAGFSPDGRFVATGSEDTTARLWDASDGHPLTPPLHHEGRVTCAGFDSRNRRLATGGGDQTVRLWSVPEGAPVGAPLRHGGSVARVAWQPGGALLLTASGDGFVRLWNPEPDPPSVPLTDGFTSWNAWFMGEDDRFIASGPGGRVRLFHATNGAPASPPIEHPALVDQAALSPDGTRLLTACRDTWTRVWDLASGREIAAAKLPNTVSGVAWRPDGRMCEAFADEPAVHLLDAATGQTLVQLTAGSASVHRVALSPDGQLHAAACRDGVVRWWNVAAVAEPRLLGEHRLHARLVTSLRFSPDGRRLLTTGKDRVARLTGVPTCAALGEPMVHTDAVADARFGAAGARLVTASDDGTARVWDAATGRPLGPPLRPHGGVRSAQFSPDGRFVLTRNADAVQVRDAATGTLALPRFAPEHPVAGAGFSPDSRRLWVVSEQPRLYSLDLTPGVWTVDEWQFAARFLSCREVDATGGLVAWSPRRQVTEAANADEAGLRWERLRRTAGQSSAASVVEQPGHAGNSQPSLP